MVRGQQDKPRLPGNSMEGPVAPPQPAQPRKKKAEDFKFGKILGEGSFSTVRALIYSNAYSQANMHGSLWNHSALILYTPCSSLHRNFAHFCTLT